MQRTLVGAAAEPSRPIVMILGSTPKQRAWWDAMCKSQNVQHYFGTVKTGVERLNSGYKVHAIVLDSDRTRLETSMTPEELLFRNQLYRLGRGGIFRGPVAVVNTGHNPVMSHVQHVTNRFGMPYLPHEDKGGIFDYGEVISWCVSNR